MFGTDDGVCAMHSWTQAWTPGQGPRTCKEGLKRLEGGGAGVTDALRQLGLELGRQQHALGAAAVAEDLAAQPAVMPGPPHGSATTCSPCQSGLGDA